MRVALAVDGAETQFVMDHIGLAQVLVEISGTERVTYTYGLARLAQLKDGSGSEWLLGDALGSVRQLVDDSGDVVLVQSYTPYGQFLSTSGTGSSGYAFTGEQYARYIDMVFLRARWYDVCGPGRPSRRRPGSFAPMGDRGSESAAGSMPTAHTLTHRTSRIPAGRIRLRCRAKRSSGLIPHLPPSAQGIG